MNHVDVNALTRSASLSRLGAAALAVLTGPTTADAKKNNTMKVDVSNLCNWVSSVRRTHGHPVP